MFSGQITNAKKKCGNQIRETNTMVLSNYDDGNWSLYATLIVLFNQ